MKVGRKYGWSKAGSGQHGGAVGTTAASQLQGSMVWSWVWALHVPLSMWLLLWFSCFFWPPKSMPIRGLWIGMKECVVCVHGALCLASSYPGCVPKTDSGCTVTLTRIMQLLEMNEWNRFNFLVHAYSTTQAPIRYRIEALFLFTILYRIA